MEDYKSNSDKARQEQQSEKKVEAVITGAAKTRKKGEMQKFADVFIAEDANNVKSYILMEVIVPAVKKAISDIVTTGIDMILYGEAGRSKKNGTASKVSYRNYYDQGTDRVRVGSVGNAFRQTGFAQPAEEPRDKGRRLGTVAEAAEPFQKEELENSRILHEILPISPGRSTQPLPAGSAPLRPGCHEIADLLTEILHTTEKQVVDILEIGIQRRIGIAGAVCHIAYAHAFQPLRPEQILGRIQKIGLYPLFLNLSVSHFPIPFF